MSKLKLSKNLLQMKFMQRTKEQFETEADEESSTFNQNYSYLTKKQRYLFEPSYAFFEDMRFGRLSYKGMNAEIEKLMQDLNESSVQANNKSVQDDALDDVEITDEEMARRYKQLHTKAGAPSMQANRKRKRDD